MDTLLIEPHADLGTIQLEAIAALIQLRQSLGNLLGGLALHIFQRHHHSEIGFIAASDEHLIDLVVGKRKSRGLFALCFINQANLFCFGEEQVQR